MAKNKQTQQVDKKDDKPKVKQNAPSQSLTEQSPLTSLSALGLNGQMGQPMIQTQREQLGNMNLSLVQRQLMADEIAHMQGNQHMVNLVQNMAQPQGKAAGNGQGFIQAKEDDVEEAPLEEGLAMENLANLPYMDDLLSNTENETGLTENDTLDPTAEIDSATATEDNITQNTADTENATDTENTTAENALSASEEMQPQEEAAPENKLLAENEATLPENQTENPLDQTDREMPQAEQNSEGTGELASLGLEAPAQPGQLESQEAAIPVGEMNGDAVQGELENFISTQGTEDSTDKILALVEQARSGDLDPESIAQEREANPEVATAETAIQRYPDDKENEETVDLAPFNEEYHNQYSEVLALSQSSREEITLNAQAQQEALTAFINEESMRLETMYTEATEGVQLTTETVRTDITTNLETQIELTNQTADAEVVNLETLVQEKQQALYEAAEAKAADAETYGEEEAQYALQSCEAKANEATTLGANKGGQYSGYDRAGDISSMAQGAATEVAGNIRSSGQTMAQTARSDMSALAAKFRDEARQTAEQFINMIPDARTQIEDQRSQTIAGLQQMAHEAFTQLDQAESETLAGLEQNKAENLTYLVQAGAEAMPQIAEAAEAACDQIDQGTATTLADLDAFAAQIMAVYSGKSGDEAQQKLDEATQAIADTSAEFGSQLSESVAAVNDALTEKVVEIQEEITGYVEEVTVGIEEHLTAYEENTAEINTQINEQMESTVSQSTENMQGVATQVGDELQQTIEESTTQWEADLTQGKTEVHEKIERGLAEHDAALADLESQIDEKAEELEGEGFWDRVGNFIGGLVSGIVHGLTALVNGIITVVVTVLKVLAVVALAAVALVALVGMLVALVAIAIELITTLVAALAVLLVAPFAIFGILLAGLVTILALGVALLAFLAVFYLATALLPVLADFIGWRAGFLGRDFDPEEDVHVNLFNPDAEDGDNPLTRVEDLDGELDPDRPTVVIVHGWNNDENESWMQDIARAEHAANPDAQILIVGWGEGSHTLLPYWASYNLPMVGQELGDRLVNDYGLDPQNIKFVGHSFGTYVANEAAQEMGGAREMVALDPANDTGGLNLFNQPDTEFDENFDNSMAIHSSGVAGNYTENSNEDYYVGTSDSVFENIGDIFSGDYDIVNEIEKHSEAQNIYIDYLEDKANRDTAEDPYSLEEYMHERVEQGEEIDSYQDGEKEEVELSVEKIEKDGTKFDLD